jgi:hypothetical protein
MCSLAGTVIIESSNLGSTFLSSLMGSLGTSQTVVSLMEAWSITLSSLECLWPLVLPQQIANDKSKIILPLRFH